MDEKTRQLPATLELCPQPSLPDNIRRKPNLSRLEAVIYLERQHGIIIAAATLAKKAVHGNGPPFHKAGPSPLYPKSGLDAWAAQRLGKLRNSTSDT